MTEPSAVPGRAEEKDGSRLAARPRSAARQAVILAVTAIVSYGLTLTLLSDTFFWFAIPGVLGLIITVVLVVHAFLNRAPGNEDGRVVAARFAAIVLVSAALTAVPALTGAPYAFPLMGVGLTAVIGGGTMLVEQRRGGRRG